MAQPIFFKRMRKKTNLSTVYSALDFAQTEHWWIRMLQVPPFARWAFPIFLFSVLLYFSLPVLMIFINHPNSTAIRWTIPRTMMTIGHVTTMGYTVSSSHALFLSFSFLFLSFSLIIITGGPHSPQKLQVGLASPL